MQLQLISKRLAPSLLIPGLLLVAGTASFATSITLEGLNKGDTNNWVAGNLQNWQELDYIPCRVRITGGPITRQTFTITFPHIDGTTPGFESLFNFTISSNVVFVSAPTLSAPAVRRWSLS